MADPSAADLRHHALLDPEPALRPAQLASDVAVFDRLLDDTLFFAGPDGTVYGKAGDLDADRHGGVRITCVEPSEPRGRGPTGGASRRGT